MGYRDGPLVLKGVNAKINNGEKVGVVGRTGAGKSTLLLALLRAEKITGKVVLLTSIPIKTLRSRVGLVPQET